VTPAAHTHSRSTPKRITDTPLWWRSTHSTKADHRVPSSQGGATKLLRCSTSVGLAILSTHSRHRHQLSWFKQQRLLQKVQLKIYLPGVLRTVLNTVTTVPLLIALCVPGSCVAVVVATSCGDRQSAGQLWCQPACQPALTLPTLCSCCYSRRTYMHACIILFVDILFIHYCVSQLAREVSI